MYSGIGRYFSVASILALLAAGASQAQEPPDTSGDVVVTATKTSTPEIDVPQSTSVVTRRMLDDRQVQDLNSALAYTAGVKITDYPGGQGAPDIYLRGFRTINFIGIYRDGLRAGFNAYDALVEPYAFDRIETLLGPASVLYGQGLPGGLVNLVTKQPTSTAFGEALVQTGSYDRAQAAFDVGGPADADGHWLYRLTGLGRRSDTQVDYTHDDRGYIAPALTWRPDKDTRLTLLLDYTYSLGGGAEQSLPSSGTIDPNPIGKVPRGLFLGEPDYNQSRVQTYDAAYLFERRFGEHVTLRSKTRYEHSDSNFQIMGSGGGDLTDDRIYALFPQQRRQSADQVLTDNSVQLDLATGPLKQTLLAGVDFSDYSRDDRRRDGQEIDLDIFAPLYGTPVVIDPKLVIDNHFTQQQTGLYGQDQMRLGRFALTAGVRHDWTNSTALVRTINYRIDQDDSATTGRVGLLYESAIGLDPYVSYSTSFVPQFGVTDFDGHPFDPTEGEQVEVGLKYRVPGTRGGVLTAAAFNIDQTNVLSPDPLHLGYAVATGAARSRGIELQANTPIAAGFSVTAAYSYTDARVSKDTPDPVTKVSRVGLRLPDSPLNSASAWLNYSALGAAWPVSGGVGVRYVGATYDATNVDRAGDYTLVDAALRLELGKLAPRLGHTQLALNASNLFDKRYYTPGFYTGTVFAGFDRNILATLTHDW